MARAQGQQRADSEIGAPKRWPALALVALVPLVWLLSVTFTAGLQKIGHPSPSIGFLAKAKQIQEELLPPSEKQLERAYAAAATEIIPLQKRKPPGTRPWPLFPDEEIRALAGALYDRVDWTWMMNGGPLLTHGWKPETGFLKARWNTYCEHRMLYLLAIGVRKHAIPATAWDAWQR